LLRFILARFWIAHWWFKVRYRGMPAAETFFKQQGLPAWRAWVVIRFRSRDHRRPVSLSFMRPCGSIARTGSISRAAASSFRSCVLARSQVFLGAGAFSAPAYDIVGRPNGWWLHCAAGRGPGASGRLSVRRGFPFLAQRRYLLRAPCPPCLLPKGRLARDRCGLIDGVIWLQDGCASIVLPQWRLRDFLPLGSRPRARKSAGTPARPFLARQESPDAAILRCAPALTGASPIAWGLSIAIETAMVAGSSSQGETTWE
jgi:hypothetical protein